MPTPQPKSLRESGASAGGDFPNLIHARRVLRYGQRAERRAAARWLHKQESNKKAAEQCK
ncbi:MAG: hypothetical protein EB121_05060 [Alphaproteobacteria bacterium]|nr:hypothetical protein [Alphaproteobacteria bacterium]